MAEGKGELVIFHTVTDIRNIPKTLDKGNSHWCLHGPILSI